MTKRSRREEFKEAIAAALELQMNDDGLRLLDPFLESKDLFLEIQRSDWFKELTPSTLADPLGIAAQRQRLLDSDNSAATIFTTVQASTNGACIYFWTHAETRCPQDRVDLDDHNAIVVTLKCKLAGLHVTLEEGVLLQPVPNRYWLYHPERMRCSRPHLLSVAAAGSFSERQKIVTRYLDQTYSRWAKLNGGHMAQILEGMATQNELEANYLDFHKAGRHIYRIEPELLDMLRSSDIDELPYEALKLPHRAMYMHFGAQDELKDSLDRPLEGVYVCEGEDVIHFCFVFETVTVDSVMDWVLGRDPVVTIELNPGATLKDALANGLDSMKITIEKMKELANRNPNYYQPYSKEWMQATLDNLNGIRCLKQVELTLEFHDKIIQALTLAVNGLLYITTYDGDVETEAPEQAPEKTRRYLQEGNPEQRARALKKLTQEGFVLVNHVGGKVRDAITDLSTRETGTRRAHWRRGFWRMQRFGKGFSEARLTWVRPTIVGGQGAPAEPHGVIHQVR